jgi:acyl carrier protein
MTIEEISHKVNEFLAEEFETDLNSITPEAPLKETLELDSLDYIDLVVILEGNFGIKVKQEEFTSIVTFNDLYHYVQSKMQQPVNG